jgi:hypothetical protein
VDVGPPEPPVDIVPENAFAMVVAAIEYELGLQPLPPLASIDGSFAYQYRI